MSILTQLDRGKCFFVSLHISPHKKKRNFPREGRSDSVLLLIEGNWSKFLAAWVELCVDDGDDFNRVLELLCAMIACGLLLMTAVSELYVLYWVTYRKPQFQEVQEVPTTSPGDGQGV